MKNGSHRILSSFMYCFVLCFCLRESLPALRSALLYHQVVKYHSIEVNMYSPRLPALLQDYLVGRKRECQSLEVLSKPSAINGFGLPLPVTGYPGLAMSFISKDSRISEAFNLYPLNRGI